jgi:uncharacterized protein
MARFANPIHAAATRAERFAEETMIRCRWSVLALAVGLPIAGAAHADPVLPRMPMPQSWVVDEAGLLSAEEIAEIDQLGDQVHARDGAAIAVLTRRTLDGADPRTFATKVFNAWGLGDDERDNGLLIFVAIDDRAAEIILGDGIDSDEEVEKSDRIMQGHMVPLFRSGDNAVAILSGVRASAEEFFGVDVEGFEASGFLESPWEVSDSSSSSSSTPWWKRLGTVIPGGLGVVGFLVWVWYQVRKFLRNRPRDCKQCRRPMIRLDEQADDAHLAASEKVEERLESVDYDIWHCPSCDGVVKLRYGNWFSSYSRCSQCKAVTNARRQKTLRAATTTSTGSMEVHESCKHCGLERTFTKTIPRVSTSSSSGSSSSRSSGGGSSSGRGSSGRW